MCWLIITWYIKCDLHLRIGMWRCRIYFVRVGGLVATSAASWKLFFSQKMTYLYIQTFEILWLVGSFLTLEDPFQFPSTAHGTKCLHLTFHLLLPPDHIPWRVDSVPTRAVPSDIAMAVFQSCLSSHPPVVRTMSLSRPPDVARSGTTTATALGNDPRPLVVRYVCTKQYDIGSCLSIL
jgi:hypothetical protein